MNSQPKAANSISVVKTSKVASADGLTIMRRVACRLGVTITYLYTVSMKIDDVTAKSFAAVLQLNEDFVPHVSSIGREDVQWFAEHAAYFRTVEIDKRLAGFLIGLRPGTSYSSPNYRWFCDNYNDLAYVDRVVVAAWARRRGVAVSLYNDFERSQSGVAAMTCEVNVHPPNEGSMLFHERQGFNRVGSQVIDGGKKEVAYLEKVL